MISKQISTSYSCVCGLWRLVFQYSTFLLWSIFCIESWSLKSQTFGALDLSRIWFNVRKSLKKKKEYFVLKTKWNTFIYRCKSVLERIDILLHSEFKFIEHKKAHYRQTASRRSKLVSQCWPCNLPVLWCPFHMS